MTAEQLAYSPAFPIFPPAERDAVELGMTVRQYFAGEALNGFLSDPSHDPILRPGEMSKAQATARLCCNYADALIAELAKPTSTRTG